MQSPGYKKPAHAPHIAHYKRRLILQYQLFYIANPSAAVGVLVPVCIWYRYYPKLQSCVPFTPVTGTRLLVAPGPTQQIVMKAMAQTLLTLTGGHQRQCLPSQQAWLDQYM